MFSKFQQCSNNKKSSTKRKEIKRRKGQKLPYKFFLLYISTILTSASNKPISNTQYPNKPCSPDNVTLARIRYTPPLPLLLPPNTHFSLHPIPRNEKGGKKKKGKQFNRLNSLLIDLKFSPYRVPG